MNKELIENFRKIMGPKSTEDLKQILDTFDTKLFSPEYFEAIRQELMERQPQSKGFNGLNNQSTKKDAADGKKFPSYVSRYQTARLIARFVSAVGWIFSVIGVLSLILFVISVVQDNNGIPLLISAFAGMFAGLALVMAGQMARATLDTADNTGEMLIIFKNKNGIS